MAANPSEALIRAARVYERLRKASVIWAALQPAHDELLAQLVALERPAVIDDIWYAADGQGSFYREPQFRQPRIKIRVEARSEPAESPAGGPDLVL